jgi:hypothetical protein
MILFANTYIAQDKKEIIIYDQTINFEISLGEEIHGNILSIIQTEDGFCSLKNENIFLILILYFFFFLNRRIRKLKRDREFCSFTK